MSARDRFERTTCDCAKCVAACRFMPGMLGVDDLDRIAAALGEEPTDDWLKEHFQASDGAKVMQGGRVFNIPTIVPRLTNSGCVFLVNDRCRVHAAAPFGCGWLDMHMTGPEGDKRVQAAIQEIYLAWQSPTRYAAAWTMLREAGCVPPPLVRRRVLLAAAIEQLEQT